MEITTHIQFALPSKPTLRVKSLFPSLVLSGTGLLPSMAAKWLSIIPMVLTDLQELGLAHDFTRPYRHLRLPDSKSGLVPFRSPLLRESLLVSFPPLNDMLKFRGSPWT
jgi:hypothetical protein